MSARPRIRFWQVALGAILAFGAYATFVRFTQGLGASTNLSDATPWGLWIGFDVLVGVGIAAGGFTVAAAVHLFGLHKYEPVARPAVLTAFLGYLLVCMGLLFDLGQPWDIWHPLIMWQPHSVMFEVAWCVMLYTTVLALEFSPVVLERFNLKLPLKVVRAIYIPLVIVGVLLSMMHQSSLGSLYLIMPEKLYGLWYTPWMPVFFFITAVAAGLAMTIVESYLSHRAFGKHLEDELLQGLGKVIVVVLAVYFVWKLEDLAGRGNLGLLFQMNTESVMFWGEMGLGVLLPMGLMWSERLRKNRHALFFAAVLTVMGFVVSRLNVALTGMARATGESYFPSAMEIGITLALVAAGFVAFGLAVKHLDLFPQGEMEHARPPALIPALGLRGMPTANGWGLAGLWVLLAAGAGLVAIASEGEAASPADDGSVVTPAPVDLGELSVPEDYTWDKSDESPGAVTFSHESHMGYLEEGVPPCASCHTVGFSLVEKGRALGGPITMERMRGGALCGACHDGERAFGVTDEGDCSSCHDE